MFANATLFNNGGVTLNWLTFGTGSSLVTTMSYMFQNARSFNQNVDSFKTNAVTEMIGMFQNASSFNQVINQFNSSGYTWVCTNLRNVSSMFAGAVAFNKFTFFLQDYMSVITNTSSMFESAVAYN